MEKCVLLCFCGSVSLCLRIVVEWMRSEMRVFTRWRVTKRIRCVGREESRPSESLLPSYHNPLLLHLIFTISHHTHHSTGNTTLHHSNHTTATTTPQQPPRHSNYHPTATTTPQQLPPHSNYHPTATTTPQQLPPHSNYTTQQDGDGVDGRDGGGGRECCLVSHPLPAAAWHPRRHLPHRRLEELPQTHLLLRQDPHCEAPLLLSPLILLPFIPTSLIFIHQLRSTRMLTTPCTTSLKDRASRRSAK